MASTRDKRMKTDSPTPAQANEAMTPTTKTANTGAIKLKRMSRSRSGMLSSGKLEGEDGNDSVGLSEDTQSSTTSATTSDSKDPTPKTPNTRPKRTATKDDAAADSNGNAKEESKEVPATIESPLPKRVTKSQALKNKAAEIAKARRIAMLKRTSLPIPVKASLRNLSRRTSSTTPAKAPESKEGTPTKKGKVTRKNPEKKENEVEDDEEQSNELEVGGDEKSEELEITESDITVKQEKLEEKIDIQNVRRSTRQRKSTIKDRDSPFTRRSQTRDKSESKRDSVSPALSSASSVKMEKESAKAISINVDTASTDNKDPSLSPELVSEEMDSESVQHLYDKPDFLENNLGIEKDPKLGEIVKVQEKTKVEVVVVEEAEPMLVKVEEEVDIPIEEEEDEKCEEEEEEKVEKINGSKNMEVDETLEEKTDDTVEEEMEIQVEKEEEVGEIKPETPPTIIDVQKPPKIEESLEENKENNVESSAKSIGSNSPRSSEDRLKIMSEGNLPKIESNEATDHFKEKVNHFKSLGLLTHKAAGEAKLAKIKRKEEFAVQMAHQASRKAKYKDSSHDQQTQSSKTSGTLKTIIKLPKSDKEKRKSRMPLKMTFQKKSRDKDSNGSSNSSADTFYTIQNEKDSGGSSSENHGAISRKSHNRSYNHDHVASSNDQNKLNHEPVINKELEQSLVIPEKASSFKVHPERICKDQCFYCGGKFGLYDTPCHIAQIKTTERQDKILKNEEKLTRDSCLCDACFRHVDRRANCPGYKSKLRFSTSPNTTQNSGGAGPSNQSQNNPNNFDRTFGVCNVIDCEESAVHSIRKKWFIKMRRTIAKIFQVNLDLQPTNTNVSICEEHFAALSHIMVCAMCKRKLPRNHIFYINQDIARLEGLIAEQGFNVKLVNSTLVVCKLCSYYNNLLFKPPEIASQKADFVAKYTKKLMKHNSMENEYANRHIVTVDDDDVQEVPVRNDDLTLTIKNGKIQPKKPQDRFHNSKEVTITQMKGSHASQSGHIMLDNDVMVGYDLPMLDCPSPPAHTIRNPNYKAPPQQQQQQSHQQHRKKKDDNNEMARVLKSNPNISMRELFPGEDEMPLQINLPFNTSSAQRTPEGWVKVQMTVQYDEVTKALWERLQRPYGNQSSFIRHLILLEKYYRDGDLILSPSASTSATTYSESVRNRLRSYDNLPSAKASTPNFSNEITIFPATSKGRNKSSDALTITPQPGNSLLKRKSSQTEMNSPKQKAAKIDESNATPKKSSPPELISFSQQQQQQQQQQSSHAKQNARAKGSNSNEKESSTSNSCNTSTTTTSNSQSGSSTPLLSNGNVIVLPDTLTQQERKQCAKSWRPTLIPITGSAQLLNSNGPLYQTADGRKLPELVQVMSGGKPYHISIHDYNKMCIIRREKLQQQMAQKQRQQQQQQQAGGSPNGPNSSQIPASTNSLSIIPMPKEKESFKPPATSTPSSATQTSSNKLAASIPNLILEQNSLIPINAEHNGKRHHQNGGNSYPKSNAIPPSMLPSALSALSKTVNALQPTSSAAAQLAAWNSLWGDSEININSDNMAALAQIANLASLGTVGIMDASAASLLSKIPKSLTVIPQAKNDSTRRSSDEHKSSAST